MSHKPLVLALVLATLIASAHPAAAIADPRQSIVVAAAGVPTEQDSNGNLVLTEQSGYAVHAWGDAREGRMGYPTSGCQGEICSAPGALAGLTDVVQIAAGGRHSLALRADGTVWAWGDGDLGQLGNGSYGHENIWTVPQLVSGVSDIVGIAAGSASSVALKSDGTVWWWGYLSNDTGIFPTPWQAEDLDGVIAVAAGGLHQIALRGDGTVWSWGYNYYGQLGNNSTTGGRLPRQAERLDDAIAIAAGSSHSLAVSADGTVYSWGDNRKGQLGLGHTRGQKRPIQVPSLLGIGKVGAGSEHSLAIATGSGAAFGWGANESGQLGDGTTTNRLAPISIGTLASLAEIDGGYAYTLARATSGDVWGWGEGTLGQLDSGSTSSSSSPVAMVSNLVPVHAISAGGTHALALGAADEPPTPPVVDLTSPQAGRMLFGIESLIATASDGSGIASVEFLVDGTVVGTVLEEPYSVDWDTLTVPNGEHGIEAIATAIDGETASSGVIVISVDNALSSSQRLEADLAAGSISDDEYAINGTFLLVAPQLMDDRYQSTEVESGAVVELAYYLREWNALASETRQTITDLLSQSRRGPLYGSVPVGSEQSGPQANSVQSAGADQCEEVRSLWGLLGTGWECQHQTSHFSITYITRGTGDYADDSVSAIDEVPAYILQLAEGFEGAYDVYVNQLNYPPRAAAVIPVSVWNVGVARVLPVPGPEPLIETIDLPVSTVDPHYLAHHELFHVLQWENYVRDDSVFGNWLPDLGVPGDWGIGPVGPLWWMEATAEWAAGYVERSGSQADAPSYTLNLPDFLGRPDERISRFDPLVNFDPAACRCRQYGAFILAEYLAQRLGTPGVGFGYNADVIRETFEALAGEPEPQFVEPAIEAVAVTYGTSFARLLPDFAKANYLLEYDDGFGGGASDVQTIWRSTLAADQRTAADGDDLAPPRPKRTRHDMTAGSTSQGAIGLKPGGSTYVELVPSPRESTGEIAITIANAPSEVEAHVMTINYPAPPATPTICIETPVFIEPDGSGLVSVPINDGCEYAVLTVTHTDYNSGDVSLDWSAEFTMTACRDSFEREATDGWGVGPLGAWAVQPTTGVSVDGAVAAIDHQFGLANLPHAAAQSGQPIELLMKWRVVPDGSESWSIDMTVSDGDPYGTYAGFSFQHAVTWGTIVGASDQRDDNPLGSGTNWWEYDSTGLPSPAGGVWVWSRLLIDDYGAYVRFWPDSSPEPVTSAPVASHWGTGGRGERWHAFEETQVPKVYPPWDRIWIDAGSSTTRFELDSLEIVQGCGGS